MLSSYPWQLEWIFCLSFDYGATRASGSKCAPHVKRGKICFGIWISLWIRKLDILGIEKFMCHKTNKPIIE